MIADTDLSEVTDGIIFYLLTDVKFLALCRVKIEPSIFKSIIQQKICLKVYNFFDSYNTIIGDNVDTVILPEFAQDEQELVAQYLYKIYSGNYVKEYVYDKIDLFLSKRAWEIALINCVDLLDRNDIDGIEDNVYKILKNKFGKSVDLKNVLNGDLRDFYSTEETGNICSPSGIKHLDNIIGGFKYKELTIIVAPLNVGKSWAFTYFGSKALLYGRTVLHITLEMSKQRVMERYFMRFAGVADKQVGEIEMWSGNDRIKYTPDTINNVNKIKNSLSVMNSFGGKLFIEEFPDKTLTIKKLEQLLNNVELENGKPPDMLLVDGLQGLKYDDNKKGDDWKALETLTHELRRVTIERGIATLASTHSNRTSIGNKLVQSKDIRGSVDILNICDLGLSLNQTNEEFELDQMRIFIMRSRTSKKWKQVRIYNNFNLGHFNVFDEVVE